MSAEMSSDEMVASVKPQHGVLVLTEESDDDGIAASRALAAQLAAHNNVPLTLYYRSEETWGDTPHPEGPIEVGDSRLQDRKVLNEQLLEAQSNATVQAWVSTLPNITAVTKAIDATKADVVVASETMSRRIFEMVLPGDSLASTIAGLLKRDDQYGGQVLEVTTDGKAKIIAEY